MQFCAFIGRIAVLDLKLKLLAKYLNDILEEGKMRLTISLVLICLSVLIAHVKSSELMRSVKQSELLVKLSDEISANINSEMLPVHRVAERIINEAYKTSLSFSSIDELTGYLISVFSSLPHVYEYTRSISDIATLLPDTAFTRCEKISEIAEEGYRNCLEKYKKDGKNMYIIFPGIISVFILVLI